MNENPVIIECMSIKEKDEIKEQILCEIKRLCEIGRHMRWDGNYDAALLYVHQVWGLLKALSILGYYYYIDTEFTIYEA